VYSSQPDYDLRTEHYRILGVDLTEIPGINTLLVQTLLAEVSPDLSKFRSAAAFVSWLGLRPDSRTSTAGTSMRPTTPAL
jgi:transposase